MKITDLEVIITGNPPPTYQWFKDGVPVPSATNASLTLISLAPAHGGLYTLVATNTSGSRTPSSLRAILPSRSC